MTAPGATPRTFAGGSDFLPFTFSADGDVAGDVVFAGYGITAPPLGYDDYAGLDVRGKVVLRDDGRAARDGSRGPFRPAEHFHYTELRHKILNAREHGAVAVIVVENPGRGDRLARASRHHAVLGHRRDLRAARGRRRAAGAPPGSTSPACGPRSSARARRHRARCPAPGRGSGRRSSATGERPRTSWASCPARMRPSPPRRSWSAPTTTTSAAAARSRSRRSAATRSIRARTTTPPAPPRCSELAETLVADRRGPRRSVVDRGVLRRGARPPRLDALREPAARCRSTGPSRWSTSTAWGASATAGSTSWASTRARGSALWWSRPAQGLARAARAARRRRRAVRPHGVPEPRAPRRVLLHGRARRLPPPERHVGQDRRGRAPDGHDGRLPGGACPRRSGRSAGLRPRPGGAPRAGAGRRRLRPVLRRRARLRRTRPSRGSSRRRPAWQPCGPGGSQERGRHRAASPG